MKKLLALALIAVSFGAHANAYTDSLAYGASVYIGPLHHQATTFNVSEIVIGGHGGVTTKLVPAMSGGKYILMCHYSILPAARKAIDGKDQFFSMRSDHISIQNQPGWPTSCPSKLYLTKS
jgi:hypothetical protein